MNSNLDIVCRQTNYSEEEALLKLEENNNDPIKVIQQYMSVKEKNKPKLSTNQMIYTEIRNFMKTTNEQIPENLKL